MKENYKENSSWLGELMKHYEIGPLYVLSFFILDCYLLFSMVMAVTQVGEGRKYCNEYYRNPTLMKCVIERKLEPKTKVDNDQNNYFIVRGIKTGQKIIYKVNDKMFRAYETKDTVDLWLTKADIMGEDPIPRNPAVWIAISGISSLCISAGLIVFCLLDFDEDSINPVMTLTMIISFLSFFVALILFILDWS